MATFNVPQDVKVDEFFKKYVPEQFPALTAGADMSALKGKNFGLQFEVDGKKFCLLIKDGKDLEVIEGGAPDAILSIAVSEADWRDSVTGKIEGVMDRFMNPGQMADARLIGAVESVKGNLKVELAKNDGGTMPISMVFNGSSDPAVRIKLTLNDWVAMQNKQVDGQTLVMTGKMQFDGDLMFLMSLQQLM